MDKPVAKKIGCVVVLGMHRSGTSLLAGILHRLGVNMGERFREADEHNPDGYFEDLDWRDLNKLLLAETGGTWYQPPDLESIMTLSENGYLCQEVRNLVEHKLDANGTRLWGFKDPRTCLTIPFLHPFLPNPAYVTIDRNVSDIVLSLMRRAKTRGYYEEADHWQNLAFTYIRRKTRFLVHCGAPVYKIGYGILTKDTWGNVIGLADFIGVKNRDVIAYAKELVRYPWEVPA